jgi:predicted transcriptional regulator
MNGTILRHLELNYNLKGQQKRRVIKRRAPRSKIQLYGDILQVLDAEANNGKILLTRIQRKIDVPFDRLKRYVTELHMLALIEDAKTLKVTKKGKQYIQEYGSIVESIQGMNQITALLPEEPKKTP